jgi:hypothetical protein
MSSVLMTWYRLASASRSYDCLVMSHSPEGVVSARCTSNALSTTLAESTSANATGSAASKGR